MFSILHTLFYFILSLGILIAFHEFGHFWAARRLGVKVLRFSLGFGKALWRYQKTPDSTEFVVSALPLGGYVRMVDEREGTVAQRDLPHAFNRQPLASRVAIVFAGPFFNFILAVLLYWVVFMLGETGVRPVLGTVAAETLAAQAGFREGDEILGIDGDTTPTWGFAMSELMERVMEEAPIRFAVRNQAGENRELILNIPKVLAQQPELLQKKLGFRPWEPEIPPVVGTIIPNSSAEAAGLKDGDLLVSADGSVLGIWRQWVDYVRARPDTRIALVVEREGVRMNMDITPRAETSDGQRIGRIGAAPRLPQHLQEYLRVEYRLGPLAAFAAALEKTSEYSVLTLKMAGRMLIGKIGVENLSGPISIAQYAGESARVGFDQFLKFLALISISLAVLNLLPIPVLDGGHLLFYLVEAIKGSPVSEQTQAFCQQIGIFVLLCLMSLAFVMDIDRLLT